MAATVTELEWLSRCKKDETETAERKHWDSRCKRYRVTYSKSKYGLTERSYSLVWNPEKNRFDLIDIHWGYKHTEAAFNRCERHSRDV